MAPTETLTPDRLTTLDALEALADQLGTSVTQMGDYYHVVDQSGPLPIIYCADVEPVAGVVMCDETEASCRCVLGVGHEGPHECDPNICTGSWDWVDGEFLHRSIPDAGAVMTAVRIALVVICLFLLAVSFIAQQIWREYKAGIPAQAADTVATVTHLRALRSLPPADWEQPRVPVPVDEDETWTAFMDGRLLADFIPTQRRGESS